MADTSATAEGELARTPLAHLLVYAMDRRLTGALFLTQADGVEHVVRLVRGAPVKVRPGDRFALLGEMLVEAGAIDQKTLDGALATKGLLGDVLLLAGRIERDALEKIAEQQFVRRMVRLYSLPPETSYRYFDGHAELEEYGGDPACVDPLSLIWSGLREHAEASSMMGGTLALLDDGPLKLHPSTTVSRFGLGESEAAIFEALSAQPLPLEALCALGVATPEEVRRFAYALVITRQLETGAGGCPLGAEAGPSSSLRNAVLPPQPSTAFARMALKSTVHRMGAAAPDLPGDGERSGTTVVTTPSRRRDRDRTSAEPASPRADDAPISSVEPVSDSMRDSGVQSVTMGEAPKPPAQPVPSAPQAERLPATTTTATLKSQRALTDEEVAAAERALSASTPAVVAAPAPEPPKEADPFAGMSAAQLFTLATERLATRDAKGALAACEAGKKLAPEDADLIALSVWCKNQLGGADVKALTVELDELLLAHEAHVEARYYRAMLRKRLGEDARAVRDLERVLELSPGHPEASRELSAREAKPVEKERPSLFGRLFKR